MSFKARVKGLIGEVGTDISQKLLLDSKEYHCFNDTLVPAGSRQTQIDHIIVSKYGLFVVETKNKSGLIFGSAGDSQWTQVLFNKKVRFQNPLRQNYLHTKSLADFLEIDHSKIHSVVVFWGGTFKNQMPENVITWLEYTRYIKSKKQILLTGDEVDIICSQLQNLKDETPFLSGLRHAKSLHDRYSSTSICPKCGGKLVERIARKGQKAGGKFLGCDEFPRCLYKRELK